MMSEKNTKLMPSPMILLGMKLIKSWVNLQNLKEWLKNPGLYVL